MLEKERWQLRFLAVEGPRQSCWLVDNVADIYVCNNKKLMIDFEENPTKVGGSISDSILPSKRKVKIRLALKDDIERLVLPLMNVFYLPYSPSNFVNLGLLNNIGIFHHNQNRTLYNQETQKVFGFAKYNNINFLLHPLHLSITAISFLKQNHIYKSKKPNI